MKSKLWQLYNTQTHRRRSYAHGRIEPLNLHEGDDSFSTKVESHETDTPVKIR